MSRPTIRALLNLVENAREHLGEGESMSHTYGRVIPRDLFNEANLLKCYGQLYLELERMAAPGVELVHDGRPFLAMQDSSSGNLTLGNVRLMVRGVPCPLSRPLNSRQPWPLYAQPDPDGDEIDVFDDTGKLTPEMRALLLGEG